MRLTLAFRKKKPGDVQNQESGETFQYYWNFSKLEASMGGSGIGQSVLSVCFFMRVL